MSEITTSIKTEIRNGELYKKVKNSANIVAATRMKVIDRRRSIEAATVSLFAKHGFRGTTTKEIAAQAGVSEASLYQYFSTKAELYAVILTVKAKNVSDDWMDEISEYATCDNDENLFRAVTAKISEQCQKDSDFLRLMLFSTLEGYEQAKQFYGLQINRLYEFLCGYIKRRQDEKVFQPCDAEVVAQGFIGAQIHRVVTEMLFGNIFGLIAERESNMDFTCMILDGLLCGGITKKKYTGIF